MNNKERAFLVSERAHRNQDYDIYPYMYHVKRVVEVAEELGFDENIIISSILHDCIEDTIISYNDIKKAFGIEVAEIVYCVTDELGRNRNERHEKTYPKIRGNWKAVAVKICDRIANMRQSKEYDSRKFKMYHAEYADFVKGIHSPDHPVNELDKAWKVLNALVEESKNI